MMGNDPKDVLKESRKKKMFSVTTFLEVCELCFGMFLVYFCWATFQMVQIDV